MLDEMVKVTKFNRKYLIRVLNTPPAPVYPKAVVSLTRLEQKRPGAPRQYHAPEITQFLCHLWHATNQACAKRLQSLLPSWLPWYEQATGLVLSLEHQVLLTRMAHTTIDRLLASERSKYRVGKGRCTTKPGTLLKQHIPIKTEQWGEERPGFLEIDTVAHCGTSLSGMFVYSLDSVDLGSAWTEVRAAWGKGEMGIQMALKETEESLPFPLRSVDSDNGTEFLNHHLHTFLTKGRRRKVKQTRSREYKKNDNAHIEQKNWTHVRQLFGYARFDNPAVVPLMNDLYGNEYSLLTNYFLPSVKLKKKERIGSTIVKRHDKAKTPVERLLAMRAIPEEMKAALRQKRATLNPFLLHQAIERKRKIILAMATLAPSQVPTIVPIRRDGRTNNKRNKPQKASISKRAPATALQPGHTRKRKAIKL